MRSSPPAQNSNLSAVDLSKALGDASESLLFADAGDLESVEQALNRLEQVTAQLRLLNLEPELHSALREQIERASHATYRLLEQLLATRDEIGSRLARIRARRTRRDDFEPDVEPKIDLTS